MINIKNKKYIYILEAIYAIYVFNFFKTKWYIHHPLEYIITDNLGYLLKHPIESSEYDSKICKFGNIVGYMTGIWIMSRLAIRQNTKININIMRTIFVGSMILNFNSFVYYLPIFLLEFLIL